MTDTRTLLGFEYMPLSEIEEGSNIQWQIWDRIDRVWYGVSKQEAMAEHRQPGSKIRCEINKENFIDRKPNHT